MKREEGRSHVAVEVQGGVAHVVYRRPQVANALSELAVSELCSAISDTSDREDVRLVILKTAGDGAFCAGADVTEMRELDAIAAERFIRGLHLAFRAIRQHSAPVIAVVQGACLGAGLELMISCDFAIASERAVFGMPEPHVGMPSVIEAALLPSIVGLMRARDLLFTGDNIDANTALRIGLLTEVVPPAELEAATARKAGQILRHSPGALRLQKELMNRWLNLPMDEAVEAGIKAFALAVASGEPKRAIASYWNARRRGPAG